MKVHSKIKKTAIMNQLVLILLLLIIVVSCLFVPNFLSLYNFSAIVMQVSDLLIVAMGTMFVILNGGIDLSVISIIGLSSVAGAKIMTCGMFAGGITGMVVALAIMVLIGLIIGIMNGVSVAYFKMPSFIATMATQLVAGGIALFITQSESIKNLPLSFRMIGSAKIAGFLPVPLIICLIVGVVVYYLLHETSFGRRIYAVGTNPKASQVSGIQVKKNILKLFVISGVLASVESIIMTARLGVGNATIANDSLMDIVGAIIIGGTSPMGGKGKLLGTVWGALFLTIINNSMNLLGVQWYIISVVKGTLLLSVALLDAFQINNAR